MSTDRPRIGVFGLGRGCDLMRKVNLCGGQLVAVCDRIPSKLSRAEEYMAPGGGYYVDFDEFIQHDMDGVIIANYFNDHARFAVKALEAGKAVMSECTAASTMADCVALVRAVEKTGGIYMLGENCPFTASSQELRRIYLSGRLGKVVFAEGEYVHPMSSNGILSIAPWMNEKDRELYDNGAAPILHWRRWLARTYYSTHAMAPLMYATDLEPRDVSCLAACIEEEAEKDSRFAGDGAAPMLVGMSDGSVFRVAGSCNFGPAGTWYRLACTKGGVETVRGNRPMIRMNFPDDRPTPGVTVTEQCYTPDFPEAAELAKNAGHGGGDFFVVYNFIRTLRDGMKPYFDVYKAVALSEMAIMGWRSALAGGVRFCLPDLRLESERVKWENYTFTPFPNNETGEPPTMPCCTRDIKTNYYGDIDPFEAYKARVAAEAEKAEKEVK